MAWSRVEKAALGLLDTVSLNRIQRALAADPGDSRNTTVSVSARAFKDLLDAVESRSPGLLNLYFEIRKEKADR